MTRDTLHALLLLAAFLALHVLGNLLTGSAT